MENKKTQVIGASGTGKSALILNELEQFYNDQLNTHLNIRLSGQTDSILVQRNIESKMTTRLKKNLYGPEEKK